MPQTSSTPDTYDIIIIGAGIAGMTAAIYAKRAGKSVLILEEKMYGGQIIQTTKIANWPGDPGISGVDLSQKIYHQMNNLGIKFEYDKVLEVKNEDTTKRIICEDDEYQARAIIIAVGSVDRMLGLPREQALVGRGISYCATCDGAFYRNKPVAVIGGGNTALYDALYLADIASKVYIVHRRNQFRGDKYLSDLLHTRPNVEFVMESTPSEILGDKKVEGLMVENSSGNLQTLNVAGIFVAIGRTPATAIFKNLVKLDDAGYIVAGEDCVTSAPGVFVAGDCRTKSVRQLVTAAADGAVAVSEAVKFLG